jgi:hypothetical protein
MGLVLRVLHAAQRMMQAPMDEGLSLAALRAELVGLLGGAGEALPVELGIWLVDRSETPGAADGVSGGGAPGAGGGEALGIWRWEPPAPGADPSARAQPPARRPLVVSGKGVRVSDLDAPTGGGGGGRGGGGGGGGEHGRPASHGGGAGWAAEAGADAGAALCEPVRHRETLVGVIECRLSRRDAWARRAHHPARRGADGGAGDHREEIAGAGGREGFSWLDREVTRLCAGTAGPLLARAAHYASTLALVNASLRVMALAANYPIGPAGPRAPRRERARRRGAR